MTNFQTFSINIDAAYDALIEEQFLPFKKALAIDAVNRVTKKMPVDTGRARGNTFVSLGGLVDGLSDYIDKGGAATDARGAGVIAGDTEPFRAVYIQNNLPYIEILENGNGTSRPPVGMFAVTAQELEVKRYEP